MFPHACWECVTFSFLVSLMARVVRCATRRCVSRFRKHGHLRGLAFSVAIADLLISTCSRSLADRETALFGARLSVGFDYLPFT